MTTAVRRYLGVSLEQQCAWRDDETALKEWRAALQRVGVFVFKDAFRTDDFSGFCLYDEEFPIIYVNNSSAHTRQIFTYFHRQGDRVFHTTGTDKERDSYMERLAGESRLVANSCKRFEAKIDRDSVV